MTVIADPIHRLEREALARGRTAGRRAFRVLYYGRDKQIHKVTHNFTADRAINSAFGWLSCATALEKPDEPPEWVAVVVQAPDCSARAFWTRRDWTRNLNRIGRAKKLTDANAPQIIQEYADAQVRKNRRHIDPEWAQVAHEYWLYWWLAYAGVESMLRRPKGSGDDRSRPGGNPT